MACTFDRKLMRAGGLLVVLLVVCVGARATDYAYIDADIQVYETAHFQGSATPGARDVESYVLMNAKVKRAAGTDPMIHIVGQVSWWYTGTSTYANDYQGAGKLGADDFTNPMVQGPIMDLRNVYTAYFDRWYMPGVKDFWCHGYGAAFVLDKHVTVNLTDAALEESTGTGDPINGGYTGPDSTWWEGFKGWLVGQFTVSEGKKAELNTFREEWAGMGPWGQLADVQERLRSGSAGSEVEAGEINLPPVYGALGGGTPDLLPAEQHHLSIVKWNSDEVIAPGTVPAHDASSPWVTADTFSEWREVFRNLCTWALYGMLLMAFLSYLKGRISV